MSQYWISRRGGATVAEAIEGYLRLVRVKHGGPERKRLQKALDDMHEGGVLIGKRGKVVKAAGIQPARRA